MRYVADRDLSFAGMNSGDSPDLLPPGVYSRSFNTLHRGSVLQCRPGFRTLFTLPDGNLQGMTMFAPTTGGEQLLFAVDGKIYVSTAPFTTYDRIADLEFSPYSEKVFWCQCEQALERNTDGSLTFRQPRKLLLIQDGNTAPAYWDGEARGHVTGGIDAFKTPLGTNMVWSGARLWVARGNQVFASDIANPLSFFEGFYIGDIGAFVMPGRVTAMAETPSVSNPVLLVFTDTTCTALQSNVRQRAAWLDIPDFQLTILPNVGCPSSRSLVAHNGVLWWFTGYGLMSFNLAMLSQHTGKMLYTDTPMAYSKGRMNPNLSGVCSASFENYLLCSVPHGDIYNRHTWVRDTLGDESWASYWTGIRPVEWATGFQNSQPKIFCASKDHDGKNRAWEAFQGARLDNGCPITWGVVTRAYNGGTDTLKKFRWADVRMSELSGTVDVAVSWAGGRRGKFKPISAKRIEVARGSLAAQKDLKFNRTEFALLKQSRQLRTQDQTNIDPPDLTTCGVGFVDDEGLDTSFQLCIIANGPGAIDRIRMTYELEAENPDGLCETDEQAENAVKFDGAAAAGDTLETVTGVLQAAFTGFTATKTVTIDHHGLIITGTGEVTSAISQQDADKRAEAIAQFRADTILAKTGAVFVGSFISGT